MDARPGFRRACLVSGAVVSGQLLLIQDAQAAEQGTVGRKTDSTSETRGTSADASKQSLEEAAASREIMTACEAGCKDSAHAADVSFLEKCDCDKNDDGRVARVQKIQQDLRRLDEEEKERWKLYWQQHEERRAQSDASFAAFKADMERSRLEMKKSAEDLEATQRDYDQKLAKMLQAGKDADDAHFRQQLEEFDKIYKNHRASMQAQHKQEREAFLEQLHSMNALGGVAEQTFRQKIASVDTLQVEIDKKMDEKLSVWREPPGQRKSKLHRIDDELRALKAKQDAAAQELGDWIKNFGRQQQQETPGRVGSSSFLAA
ncbi:unnamed protein product [Amoebophrya sp. A120]|nr:unnamed protein product [Amoebophrya sp. A120]|eukprot:GSA120T00017208001.1